MILLKSPQEIETMATPGEIVGGAHRKVREALRPGMTTGELDQLVEKLCGEGGGQ